MFGVCRFNGFSNQNADVVIHKMVMLMPHFEVHMCLAWHSCVPTQMSSVNLKEKSANFNKQV